MIVPTIFYALKRTKELGLRGLLATMRRRLRSKVWRLKFHLRILVCRLRTIYTPLPISSILAQQAFQSLLPSAYKDKKMLIAMADAVAAHTFDLLGSGPVQLPVIIDWHNDFKKNYLREPFDKVDPSFSYSAYAKTFHQDIPVPQRGSDKAVYHEDIKVLWDLGRMHHLTTLGMAYDVTNDVRYNELFVGDITSFQDQVDFACGPHWKCPMDVAIRAINLIWAQHFFREGDSAFWQRYDFMLHEHLVYLEWNFEGSDKPNNHLLADYVGYLYLAAFFREQPGGQKKLDKAIELVRAGFAQQILPDGTAYEGSTAYHRLDCELLLYATSLMRALSRPDCALEEMLSNMLNFLKAVTDQGGNLVTIGDDDSGRVVFGVGAQHVKTQGSQIFPHFGLGILRTGRFHLTLRAPVMQPSQPSGHFHHDALSMTLSIDGQPVFVDPGSFVYTANVWWRNQFKQAASHSTFFVQQAVVAGGDLFQTKLQSFGGDVAVADGGLVAMTVVADGVVLTREMESEPQTIIIRDSISHPSVCTWRFILHPSVRCEYAEGGIDFFVGVRRIATLKSSLSFIIKNDAGFAAGYGQFAQTIALEATANISQSIVHELDIVSYP